MALNKCPECNGTVSSFADVCLHCGYPIAKHNEVGPILRAEKRFTKLVADAKSLAEQEEDPFDAWCNAAIEGAKLSKNLQGLPSPKKCLEYAADWLEFGSTDPEDWAFKEKDEIKYLRAHYAVFGDAARTVGLVRWSQDMETGDEVYAVAAALGADGKPYIEEIFNDALEGEFDLADQMDRLVNVVYVMWLRKLALDWVKDGDWLDEFQNRCIEIFQEVENVEDSRDHVSGDEPEIGDFDYIPPTDEYL